MNINETVQHSGNTLEVTDTLPQLGEIVEVLLPIGKNVEQDERQNEVGKRFRSAISHYELPYFAYLRVKTDRAREIVGIPFYVNEIGREVEIEGTGWEGYFVGCRNPDGTVMDGHDIVKAIATQGMDLRKALLAIGNTHYDSPELNSRALLRVAMGDRFDDLEALKEVNKLYGAMLGKLRAYISQNRATRLHQETMQHALESYLSTGVMRVELDSAFESDLKKNADFHQKTYDSLAHLPNISFHFHNSSITTTCFLPEPPADLAFPRHSINLTPEEKEGYKLASKIGLLGNPLIRATLSLLG